ncbi:PPC domain-containing DNA-binding protein [Micromonospora sp. NPDC003197]
MRVREIEDGQRRTLVVVCDRGEEAVGTIQAAIGEYDLRAAQVTAVGGFRSGELGYFDPAIHDYLMIPIDEQVEVLSLLGDVAEQDGQPKLHVHAVCGRRDGSTIGGHLLRGEVWPTLEVVLTEVAPSLAKRFDPEIGLALLTPDLPG